MIYFCQQFKSYRVVNSRSFVSEKKFLLRNKMKWRHEKINIKWFLIFHSKFICDFLMRYIHWTVNYANIIWKINIMLKYSVTNYFTVKCLGSVTVKINFHIKLCVCLLLLKEKTLYFKRKFQFNLLLWINSQIATY